MTRPQATPNNALFSVCCSERNNISQRNNERELASFLDMLTLHTLLWTCPLSLRRNVLQQTKLERVAEQQVQRLKEEYNDEVRK